MLCHLVLKGGQALPQFIIAGSGVCAFIAHIFFDGHRGHAGFCHAGRCFIFHGRVHFTVYSRLHGVFFRVGFHVCPGFFQKLVASGTVPVIVIPDRILFIIVLVVIFGWVEFSKRENIRYDRFVELSRSFQLLFGFFGQTFLGFIGIENSASILGTPIYKLSSRIRGIHMSPEIIQQLFIGDLGWIVDDFHGLQMSGAAGRNLIISRVF